MRWAVELGRGAARRRQGNFGSPALYSVGFQFARTGYFNDDAKPDIVAGSGGIFGPSGISVALGGAQGHFKAPICYSVESLVGFDVADFDNDGKADVVTSCSGLSVLRELGDATLAQPVPIWRLVCEVGHRDRF